ncbi:hypothetical protein BDAP_002611 [Binucleata daphniae]
MFLIILLYFLSLSATSNYEEHKFFLNETKEVTVTILTELEYRKFIFDSQKKHKRRTILKIFRFKTDDDKKADKDIYLDLIEELKVIDNNREKILSLNDKIKIQKMFKEKHTNRNFRNNRQKIFFIDLFSDIHKKIIERHINKSGCEGKIYTIVKGTKHNNRLLKFILAYYDFLNAQMTEYYNNILEFIEGKNKPITIQKTIKYVDVCYKAYKHNQSILFKQYKTLIKTLNIHNEAIYSNQALAKIQIDLKEKIKCKTIIYSNIVIDDENNQNNNVNNITTYLNQSMHKIETVHIIEWLEHIKRNLKYFEILQNDIKNTVHDEGYKEFMGEFVAEFAGNMKMEILCQQYLYHINTALYNLYMKLLKQFDIQNIDKFEEIHDSYRLQIITKVRQDFEIYINELNVVKNNYYSTKSHTKQTTLTYIQSISDVYMKFVSVYLKEPIKKINMLIIQEVNQLISCGRKNDMKPDNGIRNKRAKLI